MSFDEIFDLTAGVYFHFLQYSLGHADHIDQKSVCPDTHSLYISGILLISVRCVDASLARATDYISYALVFIDARRGKGLPIAQLAVGWWVTSR